MKKLTARDYNIILRAVNGAREVFEAVSGYPLSIASISIEYRISIAVYITVAAVDQPQQDFPDERLCPLDPFRRRLCA